MMIFVQALGAHNTLYLTNLHVPYMLLNMEAVFGYLSFAQSSALATNRTRIPTAIGF